MSDKLVKCEICGRLYNSTRRHNCPHLPITDEITMPEQPAKEEAGPKVTDAGALPAGERPVP